MRISDWSSDVCSSDLKRMFIYDQVAQQTSEKLAVLHQKQLDGSFTPADKAKYLQTIFQYNEMMGRIFEDQAEIARGLAAMRAIQHTKNKYGELNKMLSEDRKSTRLNSSH